MGTVYKFNGNVITIKQPLVLADRAIPAESLKNPATRARLGITEHTRPPRPNDHWYNVKDAEDGIAYIAEEKPLDGVGGLRDRELGKIKRIRQNALDTVLAKSSGLGKVYSENMKAVDAIKAGNGDTTIMSSGKTATAHVEALAGNMGMTVELFKAYIEAEVGASSTKADEIENEYLFKAYTELPDTTFESIQTLASDFSAFCEAQVNPKEEVIE